MTIPTMTIEKVTETLIDYRGRTPPKSDRGIPLVTAKVIKDGFIQNGRNEYISEGTYSTWMRRGFPEQWDIVITTEAPLGEVAQLRTPERVALAQRVILLRGNPEIIDQTYYFYALRSPMVQDRLWQRATGTTVPGIKQSELRQVEIPCPPLDQQRKIASILYAYDELIENNRRRIEILEEMARNIYREWFVHFRFPGHEHVQLVDSPLGPIPDGWEVGRLDDAVTLQRGFDLPIKQRNPGEIPVFASTGQVGQHDEAKVKGPGVVTGRSGSLGTVILVEKDFWPLNTTLWVKRYGKSSPYHGCCLLSELVLEQYNSGAAVPTLNRNDVHGLPTVLPPSYILHEFDRQVETIHNLKWTLQEKNQWLSVVRDLLLVRMISEQLESKVFARMEPVS